VGDGAGDAGGVLALFFLLLFPWGIAVAAASQVGGFREYEVAQVPAVYFRQGNRCNVGTGGMDRILRDSENEAAELSREQDVHSCKTLDTHLNKSSSATRCFDLRRSCE
jgi:hypothetical protein